MDFLRQTVFFVIVIVPLVGGYVHGAVGSLRVVKTIRLAARWPHRKRCGQRKTTTTTRKNANGYEPLASA
ncbi:hypothetical protein RSSM_04496 [Rhodopirellula sallentina SM41]|uniref:Uncharacterized protein n=1 Tax=Rhodopirellula sallentina SM41 TaxID=1263870 RepID=M5TXY6_9BACT|nr:hypothetical protein RSSM_04496 [Rhodopirellula sallentina SM41]